MSAVVSTGNCQISEFKLSDRPYQICARCIMDTSDPEITFSAEGICNHCQDYDQTVAPQIAGVTTPEGRQELEALVAQIKRRGSGRDYDCVIGISGGVDSTYVALMISRLGLRPLAVHFDSGWNSELAVNNIENILTTLKIDLHTVVCDWEEMRDLQLSYFKASLANCDVPTDHAIFATLHHIARQYGVKTIISGGNYATESILPSSWGYKFADLTQLRAVQRAFGTRKLRHYPTLGVFQRYFWYNRILGIKLVRLLDYLPYDKKTAKAVITDELGWRDYGGKHFESIFTRFFQSYYLPTKFGFDKRRAHLSSLVVTGEITREDALSEMESPADSAQRQAEDKEFVAKKLGISLAEFDRILAQPPRSFRDYPSQNWIFELNRWISRTRHNMRASRA